MSNKKVIIFTATAYATLAAFLVGTNPEKLPLVLLVLPFVMVFIGLYGTIYLILGRLLRLKLSAHRRVSFGIAFLLVLTLILASIGQLTARDLVITASFLAIFTFYIGKTDFLR